MPNTFSPIFFRKLWFLVLAFLFGPLAPWFILSGKKIRRQLPLALWQNPFLLLIFWMTLQSILFFLPVHWLVVLLLYIALCVFSIRIFFNNPSAQQLCIPFEKSTDGNKHFLPQLLAAAYAIYPLVYLVGLVHYIRDLQAFSIHLPSDVYTSSLIWMAYATPAVLLFALALRFFQLRFGLRQLLFFYAGLMVLSLWIGIWGKSDEFLLHLIAPQEKHPLFFSFPVEEKLRMLLRDGILFLGFFMGSLYLLPSRSSAVFIRRSSFLSLPSLVFYSQLLFLTGDWNYYLAGLRENQYQNHHYTVYHLLGNTELKRIPNSYTAPYLWGQLAELAYQTGAKEKAKTYLQQAQKIAEKKTYYAPLLRNITWQLNHLQQQHTQQNENSVSLELPIIKPATYLTADWYALLSAVSYLEPKLADIDLKKKLLTLSETIQIQLPDIHSAPQIVPVLKQLNVPHVVCYIDTLKIKNALRQHLVPYIFMPGGWAVISGYDAGRDGFYFYAYQNARNKSSLFKNEDIDLFYQQTTKSITDSTKKNDYDFKYSIQKFINSEKLQKHIHDIGGVGLVLGSNTFVVANETQGAFWAEQGDLLYQEQENDSAAATAYAKSRFLWPSEYVESRIFYLQKRYLRMALDARREENLYRPTIFPAWLKNIGLNANQEKYWMDKVLSGSMGIYMLLNEYSSLKLAAPMNNEARLDTSIQIFSQLHRLEPDEPSYLDSLATFKSIQNKWEDASTLWKAALGLYPFGNENISFRLAWSAYKLQQPDSVNVYLAHAPSYSEEADFLTLQGYCALNTKAYTKAYAALSKSLKLNKASPETHNLLMQYYTYKGDSSAVKLHQLWQKRSQS